MLKDISSIAAQMTELRVMALNQLNYIPSPSDKYLKTFQKRIESKLEETYSDSGIEPSLFYEGKKLLAVVAPYVHVFESAVPSFEFIIDYDLNSIEAKDWMTRTLAEFPFEKLLSKRPINFNLMNIYRPILDVILDRSLNVHSVMMEGSVTQARDGMKDVNLDQIYQSLDAAKIILQDSVNISSNEISDTLDEALSLFRNVFDAKPEWGHFVTSDSFIARMKDHMQPNENQRTVFFRSSKSDKILGFFSMSSDPDNLFTSGHAAISFCLSPELWNKGYSKLGYQLFFDQCEKWGIDRFLGSTSNPAILKQAKKMKRKPIAYMIHSGPKYFDHRHFLTLE